VRGDWCRREDCRGSLRRDIFALSDPREALGQQGVEGIKNLAAEELEEAKEAGIE